MKSGKGKGEGDDDGDMCKMAAHYKVKYGLEGLEKTLSEASKRFSRSIESDDNVIDSQKFIAGSLPNLLDDNSLNKSKDSDDTGDDIPYMVMNPRKQTVKHTLSLDRLDLHAAPSHKPIASSLSSAGTFSYSSSVSSDVAPGSIPISNGYLQSPTSVKSGGISNHETIYENSADHLSGEQ